MQIRENGIAADPKTGFLRGLISQHEANGLQRTTFSEWCKADLTRLRLSGKGQPGHRRAGLRFFLAVLFVLGGSVHRAVAEPTARDLQVLARALGFLEKPPSGIAEIGIVYPQQLPSGLAEAGRIAAAFGEGLRAGNLILRPKLVAVEAVGQAGTVALLLTDAAVPHAAQIAAAIAGRSVLTVASDRSLIEAGLVVMVVRGEPRVEILVSRAAAQTAGIGFAVAFRMMIQER